MSSKHAAAFVASIAVLAAAGIGAAVASGSGAAFGPASKSLTSADAAVHAATVFARADLDRSGDLDLREYVSLAVVNAELARLNGFVALEGIDGEPVLTLAGGEQGALKGSERTRVEAVALAEFYTLAGADALMSAAEFGAAQASIFAEADRNRNGALAKEELSVFAARMALANDAQA